MRITVSEDGQIAIPATLRERLGISPGQILECRVDHGRLVATKADNDGIDPVEKAYGLLSGQGTTDQWIEVLRGEPDAI